MLWINLFVYAYSKILELFSPFTKFKNKTNKQKQGKNPPKRKNHQNHKPTNKNPPPQKKKTKGKKAPQNNQKPQPNFFLSTVILLLCLSWEGARFTSAENIPVWVNQTRNIISLKSAPNPPSPNVYIPVICDKSYQPWLLLSPPTVLWKLVFWMLS